MTDNPHIRRAYAAAAARDPGQTGFLQALAIFYECLAGCVEDQPAYAGPLERLGEPEAAVVFPVLWRDSQGRARQARGFHIQYCTVPGPCRTRLVFRRGLDLSAAKTLALAAVLEHSLAGLLAGGGLTGADTDPRIMGEADSRRFCRSFMESLLPHLPRSFRPGHWAGQAAARELDFLTGRYEQLIRLSGREPEAVTDTVPALPWAEAAGGGLCRFAELALRHEAGVRLGDQTVLIAGLDSPGLWAGERAARLGAAVTAVGDGTGCLFVPEGLPLPTLKSMAAQPGLPLLLWALRTPGAEYRPGPGLWDIPADVVFLGGGDIRLDTAGVRALLARPRLGIFEGAAGAVTAGAVRALTGSGTLFAPAIAAGAAGAAMTFFQQRRPMTGWEAERTLRRVMDGLFHTVRRAGAQTGQPEDLVAGACTAAFRAIAEAMMRKGL